MHNIRIREHGFLLVWTGAIAVILPLLGLRLWYELQGPLTADSPIYLAIGRGIINGLVPYKDLFETKPPGIFLLSALSLWLTGGTGVLAALQSIAIVSVPLTIFLAVREQRHDVRTRRFVLAGALCLGAMLALYSAERSGEFQVESFGAAFACVCAWGMERTRRRGWRAGLPLVILGAFGAIGMKEPFALSVAAVVLLLSKNLGGAVRTLAVTFGITLLLGVSLLHTLGYLVPYVTVYLREMFGFHIVAGEPIVIRALHLERMVNDLWSFSAPFAAALLAAWATLLLLQFRQAPSWTMRGGILLRHAIAAFALSLAVGLGGAYYNHHFIFALPGYAAVCIALLGNAERIRAQAWNILSHWGLAILCLAAGANASLGPYDVWADIQHDDQQTAKAMAATIDAVLDSCGEERYLFIGGNGMQPYGFTQHSPIGPIFFQYDYFINGERPSFAAAFLQSVDEANIVVVEGAAPAAYAALASAFTDEALCARGRTLPANYRLLFRKEPLR